MKGPLPLVLGSVLALAAVCPGAEPEPTTIRVLIIDGFGNHDWQRTTRLIRGVLGPEKIFRTEVSTAPSRMDDPAYETWNPDFSRCDVVIQTCNDINHGGPPWPEKVRHQFEDFVSHGGGVFVFHSGNNAFADWDAYNSMIGLGWRNKSFGTAIRIHADGTPERIPPGEGASTGHGARTDREIHRLGDHPIHTGLPRVWKTPLIEVYTHARGPAENLEILSWAEEPNTGERWPIEWTVRYGEGRIHTSTFGHVWKDEADPVDLRCAGFQTIFVRALYWLAKSDVPAAVPADFPTGDSVSLRPLKEE